MFNFFKIVPLNKFVNHTSKIISYANNSTYKVLCYKNEVQIFSRDWECTTLQIENIKFCCIPDNSDFLILLSQHHTESKIFLNVYNISNKCNRNAAILISSSVIENKNNNRVTALSALKLSDMQLCLSIGLDNGNILFYRNLPCKDIPNDAFISFNVSSKPVKGIKFSINKHKEASMFICSDVGVFCYTISSSLNLSETKLILDDMVSKVHCTTLRPLFDLDEEQYFVVAREDGLYCYTAEGRGPCYAINGAKMAVEWFGKRLIILLKTKDCLYLKESCSHLVIIDIVNKITVLNKEFHEDDLCIFPTTGKSSCLILLKNKGVFALVEYELRYKLSHLLKKNLYDIAVKLLEESGANSDIISEVYVHYGDHLLQRGDISEAIKVYSKTIGTISPFLIIKKLMDFRYNEYLIEYLSKLVETKYKMPEHIELLNNCFQRIELPRNAYHIFEMEKKGYNHLYLDNATSQHEKVSFIITTLKQNQSIPLIYFKDLKDAEIMNFFSEFGFYFIKKYPNELKEIIKHLLSDRFIGNSIFYKIIISLSLMNKLYAVDFINNIITNCKKTSIYNIWIELILHMWRKGNVDLNFVIDFFKIHLSEVCIDNVFILCRNYNFWPGIRMMYDKCSLEILSTRCLVKCFEMFPEYTNTFSFECGDQKLNRMWIQTLKTENLDTNYSLKLVTDIVKNIIKVNPYCILNIIDGFSNRKDFLISHLNEFLLNESFFTHFKCDKDYQLVSYLESRVIHMENILNNYLKRPIEFRNRSCDICKQIIKQPSVYFLCQHSYHRECVRQYSEIMSCILCGNIQTSTIKINSNLLKVCNVPNNNILLGIPNKITHCVLNYDGKDLNTKDFKFKTDLELYENVESSNPFENEENPVYKRFYKYDANLNPFNDKFN